MKRFRQVFTSLKEHSRVSHAKIATIGGFCDLDLIVVKATSPDDIPLPDRYVHELLKIFSLSPSSFRAFALSFSRRFRKTHCWRVALKCLVLLHRLLRSLPDNSPFRSEILWTRSYGYLSLYPCHFLDISSSSRSSEDYTIFIRSYARLLDEVLDCLSIESKEKDEEEEEDELPESLPDKMKEVDRILEVLPQLQSLIDRVMDCRPTGASTRSFVVQSAMKHIIRDSFICYTTFRTEIVMVLDNLFQMPYRSSVATFGIYKKAAAQANQLSEFYDWCQFVGLCGSYEYPFIDRIPQLQVEALENFLNGMWQLTESSSSPASALSSTMVSPLSSTEDDSDKLQLVNWQKLEEKVHFPRKLEKDEEEEPLLKQWDVIDNGSWESLLEASINPSWIASRNNLFYQPNVYGFGNNKGDEQREEVNGWQMQLYNPYASNPFYQPQNGSRYYGSFMINPTWV